MLSYTTVDCFTDKAWSGNPAAVFVLAPDEAVFDDLAHLQTLAIELCIPATAFVRPLPDSTAEEPHYQIRYFSPVRCVACPRHPDSLLTPLPGRSHCAAMRPWARVTFSWDRYTLP